MDVQKLMMLILLAPGAILAISLHEAMHGYVANRLGDPTAKLLGRLTLNPFKHIDIFGTILVPAFLFYTTGLLFGWAKPVPVNPMNLRRPRQDMAWVATAGPGANLVLGLVASALLYLLIPIIKLPMSERIMSTVVVPFVLILLFMLKFNIMLMLFNLLPIPPLDGGRIIVGVLPERQARVYGAIEPFGFFILIGLLLLDRQIPILSYTLFPVMDLLMKILLPSYVLNLGV